MVEEPVVDREKAVCGEARNQGRPVHLSRSCEPSFCAAVDCCLNLATHPFSSLNYSAFDASEVQVRRLGVEDCQTELVHLICLERLDTIALDHPEDMFNYSLAPIQSKEKVNAESRSLTLLYTIHVYLRCAGITRDNKSHR
jgi:hypothetical protein